MIINSVAFDYLTVTTYSPLDADPIADSVVGVVGEKGNWSDLNIMQYTGRQKSVEGGSAFIGEGVQRGRPHYMVSIGGCTSNEVLSGGPNWLENCVQTVGDDGYIRNPTVSPTRIDVQLTLLSPVEIDKMYGEFCEYARVLSDVESERGRRGRSVELQGSPNGMMTLYVGARTSPKRYCIYVKRDANGEYYIRFEVRYKKKGGHSSRLLNRYVSEGISGVIELFAGEVNTMPAGVLVDGFRAHLSRSGSRTQGEERVRDENTTLAWMLRSVVPAFRRMLDGGGYFGERASGILNDLVEYRDGLRE